MARWLKYSQRMTVVITELHTANHETPDVIGWRGLAHSVLVECKVSRADFLADAKKSFRRRGGMGDLRFYAAPPCVVDATDLPPGWGLLEVQPHRIRLLVEATPLAAEADKRAECAMLMSALRRLEISTAVYVVADGHDLGLTIQEEPEAK